MSLPYGLQLICLVSKGGGYVFISGEVFAYLSWNRNKKNTRNLEKN